MKKKTFFQNDDEKNRFTSQVNESNSFRLMFFAPFHIVIMLFEMIKDSYKGFFAIQSASRIYLELALLKISAYSVYAVLDLILLLISLVILILNFRYKKNPEKRGVFFHSAVIVYTSLLLLISVIATLMEARISGEADFTFFYFESLVITSLFYLPPFIVVPEILISNLILWSLISIFKLDTVFSPYKPYCAFLLLGFCICSVLRSHYRLKALRREDKIKELQKEAEHRDKLKSMFLANMSHEIRTPMNAIVGMSELALDYNLNDSEKNNLRQIHSSALALLAIINDILDFSKIESGKMEICSVDFDLLKTVYDVADVAKVKIKGKDIQLVVEIDPGLAVSYNGDDLRLRQILINLAGNAAKFTEKGFVIIRVENLMNYEQKEGLRFNVIDSGEGIKPEDLKKLFNAFQQVDMKANRTKEGTGLGLSISKNLIQLMGGNIGVESEYGKGSCFFFNVPFKAVSDEKCGEKYKALFDKSEVNKYHSELRNLPVASLLDKGEFAYLFAEKSEGITFVCSEAKILVVDDNETNLQVAAGLLKKYGIEAETVLSGFEALKVLKNRKFDLIFMDHQMPVMDGIETLQKIRESEKAENKHSLVIALSANAVNGASEMFLKNGFDDFLSKPVTGKDFGRCLKKWLNPKLIKEVNDKNDFEKSEISLPEDFEKTDSNKINLEAGISFSGGFKNWLSAAKTFYNAIPKKISEIQNFLTEKDYKNFTIAVHALKSSAKIIGAIELSQKAEELENLGRKIQSNFENEIESEIQKKAESLVDLYKFIQEILQKSVSYSEKENALKKSDESEISDLLNSLKSAAENNDLTNLEDCVKKLSQLELPGNIKKQLPLLKEAAENIDFEKVLSIISGF